MTEAKPYPKALQLGRGTRKYRRKVASPKQWQAIIAAKVGPCRVCLMPLAHGYGLQLHHVVSREDHGDDVADNIVPLCAVCHAAVTQRYPQACLPLCASLSDAEYAYAIGKGGENIFERAYGIEYGR